MGPLNRSIAVGHVARFTVSHIRVSPAPTGRCTPNEAWRYHPRLSKAPREAMAHRAGNHHPGRRNPPGLRCQNASRGERASSSDWPGQVPGEAAHLMIPRPSCSTAPASYRGSASGSPSFAHAMSSCERNARRDGRRDGSHEAVPSTRVPHKAEQSLVIRQRRATRPGTRGAASQERPLRCHRPLLALPSPAASWLLRQRIPYASGGAVTDEQPKVVWATEGPRRKLPSMIRSGNRWLSRPAAPRCVCGGGPFAFSAVVAGVAGEPS